MTPTIRIGLEGFTFADVDPFALVDLAAQSHYSHVGIRLIDPQTNTPMVNVDDARRLREHAGMRGVTLYGADIVNLGGSHAERPGCFATLAACGVTRLSSFHRGPDLKAASHSLGEWVAPGNDHGVTVHLEPVSYFGVDSIGAAADIVAGAGGGGITVDTLHFGRIGDDLDLLADLARTVPLWVQVCDGPPVEELVSADASREERIAQLRMETVSGRLPPGQGACGVADIVRVVVNNSPLSELVLMVEAPNSDRTADLGTLAYASLCRDAADDLATEVATDSMHTQGKP
jgi:sugar phosphate isomerase/epimerase